MRPIKSCFIISPIGQEGSDTRRIADDLMELVIEPALESFEFHVIRGDRIPRPSVITADIIQLVQSADLCIIDLSGGNANVYYECGRRHETGKPFIQLIQKAESMPFDVSGIRTIQYDLSSARSVRESSLEIQSFVKEMVAGGLEATTAGVSLSSIAGSLERIERNMNRLGEDLEPKASGSQDDFLRRLEFQANPRKAFIEAYRDQDFETAYSLIPILKSKLGNTGEVIASAGMFARVGDRMGADTVKDILMYPDEELSVPAVMIGVGCLVDYYQLLDLESEGLEIVEAAVAKAINRTDISDIDIASLINQAQKMLFAVGEYTRALPNAQQAVELDPAEPAYVFNLSLIHDKMSDIDQAAALVDRYLEMENGLESVDASHLMHAIECYVKVDRVSDAKSAFETLRAKEPLRAETLLSNDSALKKTLQ